MQERKPGDQTGQPLGRRNIRLTIAFEGTAYRGWQVQQDSQTIQGLISEAIKRITGEETALTGSGRTDAGTHARGLVANFYTNSKIPPARFVRALNAVLPRDIRVLAARYVPPEFHSRRDAISKTYRYQIYLGSIMLPHLASEYFHFPYRIDFAKMEAAASLFPGIHDFASFAKTSASYSSTIRQIFECDLKKKGRRLFLTVKGSGFLHHMVRNMAGTVLEVGRGAMSLNEFQDLFVKRDRKLAGFTAPAHGLVLLKVQYRA